jgi:hypothetical protein
VKHPDDIPDALLVRDSVTGTEWALAIDTRIISSFLESLSLNGTFPIVLSTTPVRMKEVSDVLGFKSIDVVTGSFEIPSDSVVNTSPSFPLAVRPHFRDRAHLLIATLSLQPSTAGLYIPTHLLNTLDASRYSDSAAVSLDDGL